MGNLFKRNFHKMLIQYSFLRPENFIQKSLPFIKNIKLLLLGYFLSHPVQNGTQKFSICQLFPTSGGRKNQSACKQNFKLFNTTV